MDSIFFKLRTSDFKSRANLKCAGFTLVELMIVVAIVSILAGIALPEFVKMIAGMRVKAATSDFVSDLAYARSEAIKRSTRVGVARPYDAWPGGWVVFVDADRNGYGITDAVLKTVRPPLAGSTVSAGAVTSSTSAIKMCTKTRAGGDASKVSIDAITYGGDGRLRAYLGNEDRTAHVGAVSITSPANTGAGGARLIVFGPTGRVSVDAVMAAAERCT